MAGPLRCAAVEGAMAQTLPDATPLKGKIYTFTKMTVSYELVKQF